MNDQSIAKVINGTLKSEVLERVHELGRQMEKGGVEFVEGASLGSATAREMITKTREQDSGKGR